MKTQQENNEPGVFKTEHRLVENTPGMLSSEVSSLLEEGWELYGTPYFTGKMDHGYSVSCQAMVKEVKK